MPGGDRTGPGGWGPMTGRGAGFCSGFDLPGSVNRRIGRRFEGRGSGRGWFETGRVGGRRGRGIGRDRRGVPTAREAQGREWDPDTTDPLTPREEHELLTRQSRVLECRLENIRARLGALEKEKDRGEG